jgi:hypothetical protein
MPRDQFVEVVIDDDTIEVDVEQLPISISYVLEDSEQFMQKKGSESLDITTPITNKNSKLANTLQALSVMDMTGNDVFEKPRRAVIRSQGYELLVGKALLKRATHSFLPEKATWNVYGDNADWSIDLKDKTLQSFINQRGFPLNFPNVYQSWNYDGRNEVQDYVFAPVRYALPFGSGSENWSGKDTVVTIYDLRPALSIYWIIWRAFNSLGYTIVSTFLDSDYFRRLVLPWVWGNFQKLENTVYDQYKFSANTPESQRNTFGPYVYHFTLEEFIPMLAINDSTDGMFDNGGTPGVYTYDTPTKAMQWKYPASATSKIIVSLSATYNFDWYVTASSFVHFIPHWYINGRLIRNTELRSISAPTVGKRTLTEEVTDTIEIEVMPGDVVELKTYMSSKSSGLGVCVARQYVTEFKVDYFKFAINSMVELNKYNKFTNYKYMDLFRGIIDFFDLSFRTDTRKKLVYIEPTYPHSIQQSLSATQGGFIEFDPINWTDKQDLSKQSEIELYSDFEREWHYQFKEDGADGALKKMQDRFQSVVGQAKYLLPERYKQETPKEITNRFFSALMHLQAQQFTSITGITPQIPCIFPENISNTSSTESENTFEPKIAWYKGNVTGAGGWKFLDEIGQVQTFSTLPFMFSVNYQPGGEDDPVLSYADQKIGNDSAGYVLTPGLLKRFFWQRMAIYRHGRKYKTYFKLINSDVIENLFRKSIALKNDQWIVTEVNNFQPLKDESAGITMWRWHPLLQKDLDATFPTQNAVLNDAPLSSSIDFKYIKHLILYSDIPK